MSGAGKKGKLKEDLESESKKWNMKIGERIQRLRENGTLKNKNGKVVENGEQFYDFLFDKDEYQCGTIEPNEDKSSDVKSNFISSVETGKYINFGLLALISEKCGVSLESLITGNGFYPEGTSYPPEEKAISGGGKDVNQPTEGIKKKPLQAEIQPPSPYLTCKMRPSDEMESGYFDYFNKPYCDELNVSTFDICKALVALSFIADIEISNTPISLNGRYTDGLSLTILPKEIMLPIRMAETGLTIRMAETGLKENLSMWAVDGFPNEHTDSKCFHLIDTRGVHCIDFLRSLCLDIKAFETIKALPGLVYKNIEGELDSMMEIGFISHEPLNYAINFGIYYSDFLHTDFSIGGHGLFPYVEPYSNYLARKKSDSK